MTDEVALYRARIASGRQDLARTVQALAEKVDVPARIRAAASSLADRGRTAVRRAARPEYILTVVAVVLAGIAIRREVAQRRQP